MAVHRIAILLALLISLGSSGCERDEKVEREASSKGPAVTQVVARVGSRSIGASAVAARMKSDDVDAETALEELITEELLAAEAARRGIGIDGEDAHAVERVMVRAMLGDFESEITPESIPASEVREDFDTYRDKIQISERRGSWHILVKDSTEEGRSLAESIHTEVRRAKRPKAVFERYAGEEAPQRALEVVAEELPPISLKASMEKPYKDALFAADAPGPLSDVVETKYGWHVIVLTEILPAERTTLREAEADIRERLSQQKRFERIVEVVRKHQADGLVTYDDEGVALLLAMPGLPERVE